MITRKREPRTTITTEAISNKQREDRAMPPTLLSQLTQIDPHLGHGRQ